MAESNLDDADKAVFDEVAEGAAYLFKALAGQVYRGGGIHGPVFTNEQVGQAVAAAIPTIIQARLGAIRRS
jgi:hypothetical protein